MFKVLMDPEVGVRNDFAAAHHTKVGEPAQLAGMLRRAGFLQYTQVVQVHHQNQVRLLEISRLYRA